MPGTGSRRGHEERRRQRNAKGARDRHRVPRQARRRPQRRVDAGDDTPAIAIKGNRATTADGPSEQERARSPEIPTTSDVLGP